MINGKRDGNGEQVWPNGTKYTGEWRNDQMNGQGRIEYANGNSYEG